MCSILSDPDILDIIRFKLADREDGKIDLKKHLRLDYSEEPCIKTAKKIMELFAPYFNNWVVVVDAYGGIPSAFIFHPNEIPKMKKSIYDYGRNIYSNNDQDYTHYSLHVCFETHNGTCDVIKRLIRITNGMDNKKYQLHRELVFSY